MMKARKSSGPVKPAVKATLVRVLFRGEVSVGVRPQLTVEGVHMILALSTVVAPSARPLDTDDVFPACAVTCAACCDASDVVEPECFEFPAG